MKKIVTITSSLVILFLACKTTSSTSKKFNGKENLIQGTWLTTSLNFDSTKIKKNDLSFGETLSLQVMGYGRTSPNKIEIWDNWIIYCRKNGLNDTAVYKKVDKSLYTSLLDTFQLIQKGKILTYKNIVFSAKFKRQ